MLSWCLSLFQVIPPLDPTSKEEGLIVQVWDSRCGSFLWTLEGIWAMEWSYKEGPWIKSQHG